MTFEFVDVIAVRAIGIDKLYRIIEVVEILFKKEI